VPLEGGAPEVAGSAELGAGPRDVRYVDPDPRISGRAIFIDNGSTLLYCRLPNRCAGIKRDFIPLDLSTSVLDGRLIRRRRKMLAENVNRVLSGFQEGEFGLQNYCS